MKKLATLVPLIFLLSCAEKNPLEEIKQHNSCINCDLTNADLSGLTFDGTDLSGSNLTGANLSFSKIQGVNFTGATLKEADLSNSIITYQNPNTSIMKTGDPSLDPRITKFINTNLAGVNFSNARFEVPYFINVDLTNANLSNSEGLYYLNFDGANLTNVKFEGVKYRILIDMLSRSKNIIYPKINSPANLLSETNLTRAKILVSPLSKTLLFSNGLTMHSNNPTTSTHEDIWELFDFENFVEGGRGYLFPRGSYYGSNILTEEKIDMGDLVASAFTTEYRPISLVAAICAYNPDLNRDGVLSRREKERAYNVDEYDSQDFNLEPSDMDLLVLVREAFSCKERELKQLNALPENNLEKYLYDLYYALISASEIYNCPNKPKNLTEAASSEILNLSEPALSIVMTAYSQQVSKDYEDVKNYNECVENAYKLFKTGIVELQNSLVRISIAVNEPLYLSEVLENEEQRKIQDETKKYKSDIYSQVSQLYEFENLLYPGYKNIALESYLERSGEAYKAIMSGGWTEKEISNFYTRKENIFIESMNRCVSSKWINEKEPKKRLNNIQYLQEQLTNTDEETARLILRCAYDANIAYISR